MEKILMFKLVYHHQIKIHQFKNQFKKIQYNTVTINQVELV